MFAEKVLGALALRRRVIDYEHLGFFRFRHDSKILLLSLLTSY